MAKVELRDRYGVQSDGAADVIASHELYVPWWKMTCANFPAACPNRVPWRYNVSRMSLRSVVGVASCEDSVVLIVLHMNPELLAVLGHGSVYGKRASKFFDSSASRVRLP